MRKRTVGISRILASALLVMVLVGRATPGLSAPPSEKGSGSENPGTTTLVSATSDGMQGNDFSGSPSISSDGQYVAFCSGADNLVPDDTNTFCDNDGDGVWDDNCWDIFVHDRQTGETTRVSVASDGTQADGTSSDPSISADGRHVAFRSYARNLVPGDSNPASDIFVHDRQTGETTRISLASNGTETNYDSWSSAISADGRFIAFVSWATNLVPGDTNQGYDVFLHDRNTRETSRVSVASDGSQAQGWSDFAVSISAEGRYVAFSTDSTNLVLNDTNRAMDVFVHDRQMAETTRISVASDGTQGNMQSTAPSLSADGRYVAFVSLASNLVAGDTNGAVDIFVHDRQTGETTRVSVTSDGGQTNAASWRPAISADGRYVAFDSEATNLVPGDTNDSSDIYVHDRQTGATVRVSGGPDGSQANDSSASASISADGEFVAFASSANNLVSDDTNEKSDVFLHETGLAGSEPLVDPTEETQAQSTHAPTESKLAYIGPDGDIWLMDTSSGEQARITHNGGVTTFAWSPNGQQIAYAWYDSDPSKRFDLHLVVIDLETGNGKEILEERASYVWSLAWIPDGSHLALLVVGVEDSIRRVLHVDAGSGDKLVLDSSYVEGMGVGFPFITSGVAWSPTGEQLLVYAYPSRTEILNVDSGQVVGSTVVAGTGETGALVQGACLCPRWSPTGNYLACHDFDTIRTLESSGGSSHVHPMPERSWQSPAWSPDGARIATGGRTGLWIIDTDSGASTQLLAREVWEPSWSPDGQQIAFTLVDGLGGEYHELQGIGIMAADGTGLLEFDHGSYMPLWQPSQVASLEGCGAWSAASSDPRLQVTGVGEASEGDCRAAFLLSNETDIWDLGGYTLELGVVESENASVVWTILPDEEGGAGSVFLLPSLDLEVNAFPVDRYSGALVSVSGEMSFAAFTVDTTLFLVDTALELLPGGSCVVQEDQLAYTALRVSHIIAPAVQLAWEGDFVGATDELQQLLPEALERASAVLKESGVDCGAELLERLLQKPGAVLKLGVAYLMWVPRALYDYFAYEGRPTRADMVYDR